MIETIDPSIKLIKARKIRRYLKQKQTKKNYKIIVNGRNRNCKRDRDKMINKIHGFSDKFFKLYFLITISILSLFNKISGIELL